MFFGHGRNMKARIWRSFGLLSTIAPIRSFRRKGQPPPGGDSPWHASPQEDIQQRQNSWILLTYLQIYEPDQLVKVSGDTLHQRPRFPQNPATGNGTGSPRQTGGKTALGYLVKVKGYSLWRHGDHSWRTPCLRRSHRLPRRESKGCCSLSGTATRTPCSAI